MFSRIFLRFLPLILASVFFLGCGGGGGVSDKPTQSDSASPANTTVTPPSSADASTPTMKKDRLAVDAGLGESAQQGDVQVSVVRTWIDFVAVNDGGEQKKSTDRSFIVQLSIQDLSPEHKIEYQGWASNATLTDKFGTIYARINFGAGSKVVGQVQEATIEPGKAITDQLVFEPPTDAAQSLLLQLPCSNVGGEGNFQIRIPKSLWTRASPTPVEKTTQKQP